VKNLVTYPDPEIHTVDLLASYDELDSYTVAVGLRNDWTTEDAIHLAVACDGEFVDWHPVASKATVRVTAWGDTPTVTKQAAHLAQGLLLAEGHIWPLTGVLPANDPESGAELASFTVRVVLRSTPI
jgi:hypothetical protein